MKKVHGLLEEAVSATEQQSAISRSRMAIHHYNSAEFFARQATQTESKPFNSEAERSAYRAYVVGAIFSSVAFLEALINELYISAADPLTTAVFGGDISLRPKLAAALRGWARSISLLEKYQQAALASGVPRFGTSVPEFNAVENLIHLRNSLVHFKPEWDDNLKRHKSIESRLAGKFVENADAKGAAFFPHRCLSAGCAQWSFHTAREFVLFFQSTLKLESAIAYEEMLLRVPITS